ncbi:unnamed protein product [Effrenium voratum]|nr:unnamed protein product [Effrenium voratum]
MDLVRTTDADGRSEGESEEEAPVLAKTSLFADLVDEAPRTRAPKAPKAPAAKASRGSASAPAWDFGKHATEETQLELPVRFFTRRSGKFYKDRMKRTRKSLERSGRRSWPRLRQSQRRSEQPAEEGQAADHVDLELS